MESKITLKIKDKQLDQEYLIERSKHINKISFMALLVRVFTIIMAIVSNYVNMRKMTDLYFIVRAIAMGGHFFALLLSYKFPLRFSKVQSLIYVPLFLAHIGQFAEGNPNPLTFTAHTLSFSFQIMVGCFISISWLYTAPSMIATTLLAFIVYGIKLKIYDLALISLAVSYVGFCIYACYFFEVMLKMQFLHLKQNKKMNDEMKQIFDSLSEGILLYNLSTQQVSMINQSFKKLFVKSEDVKTQEIDTSSLLNDLQLTEYHINSDIQSTDNIVSSRRNYTIIQAAERNREDAYFEIHSTNPEQEDSGAIITLKECKILFLNESHSMIMIKNLTSVIQVEKLKLENHFYEMLTAAVSHDLRTPLNSMIGLLSNVERFVEGDIGIRFLKIIENSSKFMLFLVNDLLDYFQIKNGKFTKRLDYTNIKSTIEDILAMFKIQTEEKGLALSFTYTNNIPEKLYLDQQRVMQVLINLLQNAFKFTFQGSISIGMDYDLQCEMLKITVTDTGVGIKESDKPRLFQMFGKLEKTSQINTSGIGLGLSICKKIAEAFDGEIYVTDNLNGKGSVFTFTIKAKPDSIECQPLEESQVQKDNIDKDIEITDSDVNIELQSNRSHGDPTLETQVKEVQRREKGSRFNLDKFISPTSRCPCRTMADILVVDDNVFNIITLQSILQMNYNLQSDKATNGQEAVNKVRQNFERAANSPCFCQNQKQNYKVIFMDCNMPIKDGFQATQEIREIEKQNQTLGINYRTYIVALTAYSTEAFQKKCLQSGMDNFISKPIEITELSSIVNNYLLQ